VIYLTNAGWKIFNRKPVVKRPSIWAWYEPQVLGVVVASWYLCKEITNAGFEIFCPKPVVQRTTRLSYI